MEVGLATFFDLRDFSTLHEWSFRSLLKFLISSRFCFPLKTYQFLWACASYNNNNNIYLLQMGCHPVAVITLHVFPNTANKFT
jgi:hypothetical protein